METKEQRVDGSSIRRVTRRTDDKVIAGVASGLGHYFGVDPILFRIAFVVLAISGGVGFLLYAAAWIILPVSSGGTVGDPPIRRIGGLSMWVGIALLVAGAATLASQFGPGQPSLVWGIVLIGLGVVLFRRDASPDDRSTEAAPVVITPSTQDPRAVTEPMRKSPIGARAARPRRDRSPLPWYTVGAVFLAAGAAAVLDDAGIVHLRLGQYFALALLVIAIGMLVGSVFGRARLLLIPALLLIPLTTAASLIRVPFQGGYGERLYAPASATDLRSDYHLIAGDMTFNLSNLDFATPVSIDATLVAGQIKIYVPRGVHVDARARVGGGHVGILGKQSDGLGLDQSATTAPSTKELTLDLQAGFGQIYVYREGTVRSR